MPSCIPCLSGFVVHPSIHPSTTHQSINLSIHLSMNWFYLQYVLTYANSSYTMLLPHDNSSIIHLFSLVIYVATCAYYPFRGLAPECSTCLKYLKFQVLRASLIINLISNISTTGLTYPVIHFRMDNALEDDRTLHPGPEEPCPMNGRQHLQGVGRMMVDNWQDESETFLMLHLRRGSTQHDIHLRPRKKEETSHHIHVISQTYVFT